MDNIKKVVDFDELNQVLNQKKGGFTKIETPIIKKCLHPEHSPPTMIYLPPGIYEYTCPECGESTRLHIPEINC